MNVKCEDVLKFKGSNRIAELFINKLNDLIDTSTKTCTNYNNKTKEVKPWITAGIINLIKRRNKLRYLSISNPKNIGYVEVVYIK